MAVRTYRISKEAWEAGDCQTCTLCGSSIRNVTEINGAAYGSKCAEKVLETVKVEAPVTASVATIQNAVMSPFRKAVLIMERRDAVIEQIKALSPVFQRPNFIHAKLSEPYEMLKEQAEEMTTRGSIVGKGYTMLLEIHSGK
jgi:hypothetical protein